MWQTHRWKTHTYICTYKSPEHQFIPVHVIRYSLKASWEKITLLFISHKEQTLYPVTQGKHSPPWEKGLCAPGLHNSIPTTDTLTYRHIQPTDTFNLQTHSPTDTLTYRHPHLQTRSPIHTLTYRHAHLHTHSPIDTLTYTQAHLYTRSPTGMLTYRHTHW